MHEFTRAQVWKLTAIGLVAVAGTATVTALVVANRMNASREAAVDSPSAAPSALVTPKPSPAPPAAVAQAPSPAPAPVPAPRQAGPPSREVVSACNRQASAQASAPREGKDKIVDIAKDAGIGALGGAAVGAGAGAIAGGGKGAGKGALIGGGLGAGAGTLYGILDNKKNDERYRAAYAGCMRARGYTG